jgi:hypothetical protein
MLAGRSPVLAIVHPITRPSCPAVQRPRCELGGDDLSCSQNFHHESNASALGAAV